MAGRNYSMILKKKNQVICERYVSAVDDNQQQSIKVHEEMRITSLINIRCLFDQLIQKLSIQMNQVNLLLVKNI